MILGSLTIIVGFLLWVKSLLVFSEILWLRKANRVVEEIWTIVKTEELNEDQKTKVIEMHKFFHCPKNTLSEKMNASQRTLVKLLKRVLKIRPLILFLSIIMIFQKSFFFFWIGAVSLLFANCIELIYMYYFSPVLGYSRGQMEEEAILKKVNIVSTKFKKTPPTFVGRRKFIKDYFLLLLLILFSFGGIYSGVFSIDEKQFKGVCKETWFLDLFYFSVVAMATVGYGDISPNENYWIPKFFVSVQIISSFLVIVGMVSIISIKGNQNE